MGGRLGPARRRSDRGADFCGGRLKKCSAAQCRHCSAQRRPECDHSRCGASRRKPQHRCAHTCGAIAACCARCDGARQADAHHGGSGCHTGRDARNPTARGRAIQRGKFGQRHQLGQPALFNRSGDSDPCSRRSGPCRAGRSAACRDPCGEGKAQSAGCRQQASQGRQDQQRCVGRWAARGVFRARGASRQQLSQNPMPQPQVGFAPSVRTIRRVQIIRLNAALV